MLGKVLPVEGQSDYGRDMRSGAVVALNTREFEKFMEAKRQRDAMNDLKNQVNEMQAKMGRIEEMLVELLGKK